MHTSTEQLFTQAHTAGGFLPTAVAPGTLRQLYDLLKWGPTSGNCCPLRIVFVCSDEGKARLLPCVSPGGNQAKVQAAPVTAILGMDHAFHEQLPRLYPQVDMRQGFVDHPERIAEAALKNSSLQGGYFILAARALGLDCAPMGGFDGPAMDAAFWAGSAVRTNFICCLGQADPARQRPRNPRLDFDEACRMA